MIEAKGLEDIARVVKRAGELLSNVSNVNPNARVLVNEGYWVISAVLAYHYSSENPEFEVVELYSRDGLVFRVKRDEHGVSWELSSLHSQYCGDCVCGEEE